jgi:hypothetical protein
MVIDLQHASNKSREHGELQDMYRRTLAASWVAQADELPADECIEDLFAGGDGWKNGYNNEFKHHPTPYRHYQTHLDVDDSGSPSGEDKDGRRYHRRTHSGASGKSNMTVKSKAASTKGGINHARKHSRTGSAGGQSNLTPHGEERNSVPHGRRSIDSRHHDMVAQSSGSEHERGRTGYKHVHEVGEFDQRDDLIAWKLPGPLHIIG